MPHLIVDAANVVGSRPDGWWRDRAGAATKLAGQIVAALEKDPTAVGAIAGSSATPLTVHLVLEGAAKGAARGLPTHPTLDVHLAPTDGDSAIAELAGSLQGSPVTVVTADQGLRKRVQRVGASIVSPRALREVLPEPEWAGSKRNTRR